MVARTAKTKKQKGTKLEKKVAEGYRSHKIDVTARRMPLSGAMSHFKSDIYKRFDVEWVDECKCHETISLRRFWEQAEEQAGLRNPVLHISSNYRPIVTVLRQTDFEFLAEDDRTYEVIDICDKTKWNFWKYASMCIDMAPRATVIYCIVNKIGLVVMTNETYFTIRKNNL